MNGLMRHPRLGLRQAVWLGGLLWWAAPLAVGAGVSLRSPGLAPSQMDPQGRLVEDWGALEIQLAGNGLGEPTPMVVQPLLLEQVIPGARARSQYGDVTLTLTAYRAPAWPAGLDVVTARLEETGGRETPLQLRLNLPEGARLGARSVSLGARTIVSLPWAPDLAQTKRDWGWLDDASALPGWARPEGECDPAFRNIRAGLGGVPICYRFKVEPRAAAEVVLGFCESHWSQAGQRPVVCQVEGAAVQEVDPLARWGQHRPGVLAFTAKDENGDGQLEVSILPRPGAPDLNPILNVLWVFPPGSGLNLEQVKAGRMNGVAQYYVDVGGEKDQSLLAAGQITRAVKLAPKGVQEFDFLVACPGSTAPLPDRSSWTPQKLQQAAAQVWRDWPQR